MPARTVMLGDRKVGGDAPTYVIAEVGVNHNGDPALAHSLVDAAASAGADAVKFQIFEADSLALDIAERAAYQQRAAGPGRQLDMLRALELEADDFRSLRDHCGEVGVHFIATAFDEGSLDLVLDLGPGCLKWPSGELNNWPLLRRAASSRLPMLMSTGMATLGEIEGAMHQVDGLCEVVLLQCVSSYPAMVGEQNLSAIATMANTFGVVTGFSDHTIGMHAALVARAFGMAVLEKHITLDRAMAGPDHEASMEPAEFAELVRALRDIEQAIGDGVKAPVASEQSTLVVARKSLVFRSTLQAGHTISDGDLTAKRPATGLSPDMIDAVLGRVLRVDVVPDQLVELGHVE